MSGTPTGRSPFRWWSRSLPFRVVVSTVAAVVGILAVTGWFLLSQSARGVLNGKEQTSLAEASVVVSGIGSAGLASGSIPDSLREAVRRGDEFYSTPTRITFTDSREAQPGLAIGASLVGPLGDRYPIYFLFTTRAE